MIARIITGLIVMIIGALPAAAQEPGFPFLAPATDSLQPAWSDSLSHIILPGQRTKITAPDLVSHALLGKIHTLRSPDTVVIVTDRFYPNEPDAWRVSMQNIRKYQIPEGYKRRTLTGAVAGTCFGIALATAFAVVDNDRRASDRAFPYPATVTGGGIIGALAGAITRTDLWKTVPNNKLKLGLPLPTEPVPMHTIAVSERVRIFGPAFGKRGLIGTIGAVSDSILGIADDPVRDRDLLQVPMNQITLYQISLGKRNHPLEGALAGMWIGFFIGTISGDLDRDRNEEEANTSSIIPFAAAGMIAGVLTGVTYHTDEWKTIPMDRLRLP